MGSRTVGSKRVLVVHRRLRRGGDSNVAAWLLMALRQTYRLSLLTWKSPDLDRINACFGTSLRAADLELRLVPLTLRRAVDAVPFQARLLRTNVISRAARRLLRREAYDVVISTSDEMDFGRRGIQYIHYPWNYLPRSGHNRWFHRFPLALPLYWRFCRWLGRTTYAGFRQNLSLVNSDWTGTRVRRFYGIEPVTVYPPVPGNFRHRKWSEREDGFVCLGRFAAEKELEKVIAVIAGVRARAQAVKLLLIGSFDRAHTAYCRTIQTLAARHGSWIELRFDLPRDELLELVAGQRYGIHGMVEEHFGIAPAELQRAGCVVFVPAGGGQVEIVDGDERLIYRSPEDAIEKICRVLADPDLRQSIRLGVRARRDRFTADRFASRIRGIVDRFDTSP